MSRDGRGWHGEHQRHKEVAERAKAGKANNTPMKKTSEKPTITVKKITIRHRIDDFPDLSWLKDTQDYAMEDKKKMESYGESWYMIGIDAVAEVVVPTG